MTTLFGLVHSGDSIAGSNNPASYFMQAYGWTPTGDSTTPTGQKRATYYSGDIIGCNMAISGTRLIANGYPDLAPMAPIDIDPIIPVGYAVPPNDRPRKYIFTCAIGTNDSAIGSYGIGNYALYAADVAACCVARKTAGFAKVGICTLLPRGDGGMLESDRLGYNATIKGTGWAAAHSIDYIIDLASQAIMGNPANCSDTSYYSAGLHPTAAGHALLAPIYLAGVNALIAMTDVVVISGMLAVTDAIDSGSIFGEFKKAPTRQRSPVPYFSRRDYGWVTNARPPLM